MKRLTFLKSAFAAAALFIGVSQASAQFPPSPPPTVAALEGAISSVTLNTDSSITMVVMGMTVNVPVSAVITSPTATLTPAQLADATPLPGRPQPGFIGGTAIINGTVDASGLVTAGDVFVEPSENVVLGIVTANTSTQISVNGIPVSLITDARMPANPVQDVNGIAIIPSSIPVGVGAGVEGYFSDGTFYAFMIEADEGTPVNVQPQVVITRALGRERTPNNRRGDELEVRGTCTTTHAPSATTQSIIVYRIDGTTQTLLGTGTATVDPAAPGVANFVFRVTTPPTNDPILGTAPTTVRVVNTSVGADNASATSAVEVR